jgi:hypothetical protein
MSDHTETRIHQLCSEALAAKTKADVERIIPELRAALDEHIRLTKSPLGRGIALLDGVLREDSPKA